MKRLRNGVLDVVQPLIVITVLLAGVFGAAYLIVRTSCYERAALYELDARFGFFTGCAVYTEQGWRDIDSIRQLDE